MAILNFTKLAGGGGASQGLLAIQSESYTTINGYQVPALSAEQVTAAYNAIVGLRGAVIVTRDAEGHFLVNQADVVGGDVAITILFYDTLLLTYLVEGDSVQIDGKSIGGGAGVFQLLGYPSTGDEIPYSQVAAESGITKQVIEDVVAGKYYAFRSPDGIHLIPLVYATASSQDNNYHIFFGHYFQIGSIESGSLWEVEIVGNVGYVHLEEI